MAQQNNLELLKKPKLIQICKERGIKGYSILNKYQIIHLIQNFKEEVTNTISIESTSPLQIGECIEIPSSSTDEMYTIKRTNIGYECNCRAWKFCKGPKAQKSCRHIEIIIKGNLKGVKGKKMETRSKSKSNKKQKIENVPTKVLEKGPEKLILAHNYEEQDVIGWFMSEKIDGIRAYWDGNKLWSRTGKEINASQSFLENFPKETTLDGELFMSPEIKVNTTDSLFSQVCSITRKKEPVDEEWLNISFYVFDTVEKSVPFIERLKIIETLPKTPNIIILKQHKIKSDEELDKFHQFIRKEGGEGVMIKNPRGMYVGKRSKDLLKLKQFYDTEVKIISYKPGTGKYVNMLGGYNCEMVNGKQITVGSGMDDNERNNPLEIGTFITIKYFELTSKNQVPRFPVFLRKAERQEFSDAEIPGTC